MTEDQARALFLEHCQPGSRGALERYGERAAVAAIMAVSGRAGTDPELLETLLQYESDLQFPMSDDSRQRRIERVRAVIGKATQSRRCANHPDRPVREILDGDPLCQACCTQWARGEGLAALIETINEEQI